VRFFWTCSVVLFALAALRLLVFWQEPTGTISGDYTDHIAHTSETREFFHVGLDLWRTPSSQNFRALSEEERSSLPPDLRAYAERAPRDVMHVPGFRAPIVINYARVPSCYPPGMFLVSAPSAIGFHFGILSFAAANRLYLLLLAALWLLIAALVARSWRVDAPPIVRALFTAFALLYLLYWSQEGMYDIAAVAAATAAVFLHTRKQFAYAALLWGLAAIVHSRLLGLLPLAGLSMLQASRAWSLAPRLERIALVFGAGLYAAALGFAVAIQSTVKLHAVNAFWLRNVLHFSPGNLLIPLCYVALLIALCVLLLRAKSYADAATVLVAGAAFIALRYLGPWYWLLIVPWAVLPPVHGRTMRPVESYARIALTLTLVAACLACHVPH
jgi:hypothetical protein